MPGTACGLIPANAGASSRSNENRVMRDKTYVITEVVGISEQSISRAIHTVITRASQTLHALAWFAVLRARQTLKNLDWFKVIETRGLLQDGKVDQFQVRLKVGFRLTE